MYLIINTIIIIIIISIIYYRCKKYKKIQVLDIYLINFSLFYPVGIIRPLLGYDSVIGYNMLKHEGLLNICSLLVLFSFFFLILGSLFFKSIYKSNFSNRCVNKINTNYIAFFEKINIIVNIIVIYIMFIFLKRQSSILQYFIEIDSIRQTLSGQMINFFFIYLNVLISVHLILIKRKMGAISIFTCLTSIVAFIIYGYRGPIIIIILLVVLSLQKIDKIRIRLNLKYIVFFIVFSYFFSMAQSLREGANSYNDPLIISVLTRFNGYEPLMIIADKIIYKSEYDFNIFINNILSFIQLPIPREIYPDKIKPVSILLAEDMFYDIGYRSFDTGGISPTIVGSLIWNLHLFGIFVSFFIGFIISLVERLLHSNNKYKNLLSLTLSVYLIYSVEAPENSFGILWIFIISLCIIILLDKIIEKRRVN